MTILISKIEALFLEGSLEAICFATIIYLTRKGTTILPLKDIKDFAERAVNSSLDKITDFERRMKVLEVLTQTDIIYKNIVGLNAVKGLNSEPNIVLDHSREEIDRNLRTLKMKLGAPLADNDTSLYDGLKINLNSIDPSELTWRDPEANMIIADDSVLVKNLGPRQKQFFLKPRENMKCASLSSISSKCNGFINDFNSIGFSDTIRNIVHNKEWKENESKLLECTDRILNIIRGIWNNPAFATSEMRSTQSEGTYVTDIIVPLLRASLEDLPSGAIFLSTAERQSIASKTRRSSSSNEERPIQKNLIGKKPDVMVMTKYREWKENESKLLECTDRILNIIRGIWNNPAFATSEMRSTQSEGTYVTDIIVPLLRASLEDLPSGAIFLSTAERQSIASKTRRSSSSNEERPIQKNLIGKKPDVMVMTKYRGKVFELTYVESSRVICTKSKKDDDSVKLWRETLDGISFVGNACRPASNQFGIVGIQVAGEELFLNVLIKDASGIPRYFHLDQAEMPFAKNTPWRVEPLVHLLLIFRNTMIVNQNLLMQALEQADARPPRNAQQNDDSVKLWRETLDGISFVGNACRPASNQFGIVGIQVAGEELFLNVLIKDASGIPRYFHLDQAEMPFAKNTPWRVEPLVHLLLIFRNTMIVNQNLLMQALEQADARPPRNAQQSPTVTSPLLT
ncbi:hypothetical protein Glove_281g9 [Diversispora epigaea]|uniref:Uncharacterized protein n=1 Tax=Diversispora epigaea TaxID=1348612 RepID=A0A397I7C0_9GLOM|nr:hypothetical protein Glove_281g9 [Diversispora epigaea]